MGLQFFCFNKYEIVNRGGSEQFKFIPAFTTVTADAKNAYGLSNHMGQPENNEVNDFNTKQVYATCRFVSMLRKSLMRGWNEKNHF
jgi:hypothetical protein